MAQAPHWVTPSPARAVAVAHAAPARRHATVGLDTVLDLVRRTAGNTVDVDAPLMEAGVDSLGAVELRNQLQRAAGASVALPSTVVFDHPTARQIATLLQPRKASVATAAEVMVVVIVTVVMVVTAVTVMAVDSKPTQPGPLPPHPTWSRSTVCSACTSLGVSV